MPSLTVLIAPLALAAGGPASVTAAGDGGSLAASPPVWQGLAEAFRAPAARQVRIERRMAIRVAPRGLTREFLPDFPRRRPVRLRERKVGDCLPTSGIAGVQIDKDDRLLLFMRDHRLIGARLEKTCRARDFYSGFYVERSRDGKLCVDRDTLHSRTGSACSLSRLRQLVAVEE